MDGSIRLRPGERKTALTVVRRGNDPEYRLRAHVLLLLNDGHSWSLIVTVRPTTEGSANHADFTPKRELFQRAGTCMVPKLGISNYKITNFPNYQSSSLFRRHIEIHQALLESASLPRSIRDARHHPDRSRNQRQL